jgi:hypothetical protein
VLPSASLILQVKVKRQQRRPATSLIFLWKLLLSFSKSSQSGSSSGPAAHTNPLVASGKGSDARRNEKDVRLQAQFLCCRYPNALGRLLFLSCMQGALLPGSVSYLWYDILSDCYLLVEFAASCCPAQLSMRRCLACLGSVLAVRDVISPDGTLDRFSDPRRALIGGACCFVTVAPPSRSAI